MEELGGYRELTASSRVVGDVVFIGALLLTAFLERFQLELRAAEASSWWASNGRDVANTVALGVMAFGLHTVGFNGPIALSIAATGVILLTALQPSLAKRKYATGYSLLAAAGIGVTVLAAPHAVDGFFRTLLTTLFRGTL